MARPLGTKYIELARVLASGPKGRHEIALAMGTPLRFDGHNVRVLNRHCKRYGQIPALFAIVKPNRKEPISAKNFIRWQLTDAGRKLIGLQRDR